MGSSEVIVIAGPPGAGKGTQADLLAQKLGGVHLSSGEILRQHASKQVQQEMRQGELVTEPEVDRTLEMALEAAPVERPWILDGFIRLEQDLGWLQASLRHLRRSITRVVVLDIPKDESQTRVTGRDRQDDKPPVVDNRWQEYLSKTLPVLRSLSTDSRLTEVNGVGSVEEVAQRVQEAIS